MRAFEQGIALALSEPTPEQRWLDRFHAGERELMQECYEQHFDAVMRAAGRVLRGADQENVVHDVFLRMISEPEFRKGFGGGSFRSWITTVARNRAIDYARKHARERAVEPEQAERLAGATPDRAAGRAEVLDLLQRFRSAHVPERWAAVFEARFLREQSQREAALALGMRRTTLAYQEQKLRARLRRFVLQTEG